MLWLKSPEVKHLEYKGALGNQQEKDRNPKEKWTKDRNRQITKEETHGVIRHMKTCSILLMIREVQILEKTVKYYFTPIIFAKIRKPNQGFPGGAVVKNLPAKAGNTGSSPGLGRSHMPWSS